MNSPHTLSLSSETWQLQLQQTLISHPKCHWPVALSSLSLVSGRNGTFLSDTGGFAHPQCREQIWLEFRLTWRSSVSQQGAADTQPQKHRTHKLHRMGCALNTEHFNAADALLDWVHWYRLRPHLWAAALRYPKVAPEPVTGDSPRSGTNLLCWQWRGLAVLVHCCALSRK